MPTSAEVLVDTSAGVAFVLESHPAHDEVFGELDGLRRGLAGHAWFETFSVLTRLPVPARRSPVEVADALADTFPASRFLDVDAQQALTVRCAELGIAGGSVYDALVGMTAKHHDLPLVTRDGRALEVYRRLGVEVRLLR